MARGMKRTSKKKVSKRRSAPKARVSKKLKRAVKKIVAGTLETKSAGIFYTGAGGTTNNSQVRLADTITIIPPIGQGSTTNQREGDSITPTSFRLKGTISHAYNYPTTSSAQRPMTVRIMVLTQRNIGNEVDLATNFDWGNLLSVNSQGLGIYNKSFDGVATDTLLPINRDLFRVHHDSQHLLLPNNYDPAVATSFAWHVGKNFINYNIKVPLPKKLKYDQAAAPTLKPVNTCPFMVIGYTYADGTSGEIITQPLQHYGYGRLAYKDA